MENEKEDVANIPDDVQENGIDLNNVEDDVEKDINENVSDNRDAEANEIGVNQESVESEDLVRLGQDVKEDNVLQAENREIEELDENVVDEESHFDDMVAESKKENVIQAENREIERFDEESHFDEMITESEKENENQLENPENVEFDENVSQENTEIVEKPTENPVVENSQRMVTGSETEITETGNSDPMMTESSTEITEIGNPETMMTESSTENAETANPDLMMTEPSTENTEIENSDLMMKELSTEITETGNSDPMMTESSTEITEIENSDSMMIESSTENTETGNSDPMMTESSTENAETANPDPMMTESSTENAETANTDAMMTESSTEITETGNPDPMMTEENTVTQSETENVTQNENNEIIQLEENENMAQSENSQDVLSKPSDANLVLTESRATVQETETAENDQNPLDDEKSQEPEEIVITETETRNIQVRNFEIDAESAPVVDKSNSKLCTNCRIGVNSSSFLTWQTMIFCKLDCLTNYQSEMATECANCQKRVLFKRFVRLGRNVKLFCSVECINNHKTTLKFCTYCQEDISKNVDSFVAMVGEKGQFKEFCTKMCMQKFQTMNGIPAQYDVDTCAVCGQLKPVSVEVLAAGNQSNKLCSEPCLAAFKFVNDVSEGQCAQCLKYFAKTYTDKLTLYFDNKTVSFCGKTCSNAYIFANRRLATCSTCKSEKFNVEMIHKQFIIEPAWFCSAKCLKNFLPVTDQQMIKVCHKCKSMDRINYKVLYDGDYQYFCSIKCATKFRLVVPLNTPTNENSQTTEIATQSESTTIIQQVVVKPASPKKGHNKSTLCKPITHNKGTYCRPMPCMQETQTDVSLQPQMLIPIPVPIYIPAPLHMYSSPYPVPIPFPLPIPVPIFIPTTKSTTKGILKEMKKIQEKMPTDPFEAELLMMAEMVAGDKKTDMSDSDSDGDAGNDPTDTTGPPDHFSPEVVDTSNAFGEDMLQMALKMATELDEPAVDMESVLTSSTITPNTTQTVDTKSLYGAVTEGVADDTGQSLAAMRGRKRSMRGARNSTGAVSGVQPPSKRGRRSGGPENTLQNISNMGNIQPQEMAQAQRIEVEKPDAHMRLKYTYGVNAWRHWVVQKNMELEKAMLSNRKIKPFKPDLLQLTADELNFSLCLFVKEVKKPNLSDYAPDTIYYLCLGIQQYLFENGRIDNIFTDVFYEKFTDYLDEVAKRFQVLYNDARYIVTRVEEEHLWESKQLGAHSPHVLLSTLMFFNTKHFNLVSVEEHMQLSFSHIMKHWKRNPNSPGVTKVPGSRNVLLRFYPPQSALEANSRKKKLYEQQENEENPLRCPVKLYEFYLSKCPESVKTRNDVFYLLPERSCVPDSPVWYSTMALGKEPLMKMLHRIKMVKEINVALLSS